MLARLRIWQILSLQLLVGSASVVFFGLFVHFPDVARRPNQLAAGVLFLLLLGVVVPVILHLTGIAAKRAKSFGAVFVPAWTIGICMALCYAFVFLWLNTFGS
jgi:hypothetical protein